VGYNEEELMLLTFQDITHPDDLDTDLNLLQELIDGKRSFYHMEKRYICKDGSIVYIILAASAVRDENNKVLYFISQIIDITAQKKAEQELELALSKIQGIFDASTQVSIIETDVNGIITTFNVGAENLLGYKKEEIIFLKTPETIHLKEEIIARGIELSSENNCKIEGFNVFTHAANNGEFETREWTYVKKDRSQFPVQLTVTAVKNREIIVGYLGIAVDISIIKKAENEIQSLLHVTKDQNERLKNFAHIVSHNLRSHSGNIAMMLDLLLYENPTYAENEIVQLLDGASKNLKETIGHLNEVVLMNTTISENLITINLQKSLKTSINSISALAKISNVTIYNEVDPNLEILGISAYVDSILLNFLSNAVKYKSDKRSAFIKLYTEIENDFVVLHIEDNGLGIDLKKHSGKLFGMYKTFHGNSDARGIGLFITKNQIEAISGKIKVTSDLDKGTTFKLYFKYA
jgi:PAS domain S-box-containing protein